jgi:methanol metabolism-related c-type cytochrome
MLVRSMIVALLASVAAGSLAISFTVAQAQQAPAPQGQAAPAAQGAAPAQTQQAPAAAPQQGPGDPAAVSTEDDGKSRDAAGDPTFKIESDGTVDWLVYSGYRRYHSECHVCHGPDGEGSSYAPKLVDSLKRLNYTDYLEVVTNGRKNVTTSQENVMPAFGTNLNVMCFVDDIYVYLRARAQGDLPRGRPAKHAKKPQAAEDETNACFGTN